MPAHEAFKALGPVEWASFAEDDLTALATDIFSNAQRLVASIPGAGEADPPSLPDRPAGSSDDAAELSKGWKEVKLNLRDNPLDLHVYKQSARDGKGAWFSRRSLHHGLSFERWKTGLQREFAQSLKVQGQPGAGKIRGLGTDKCVVDQTVDGCGKIKVYQLSAQFPSPATARDFVTLCLSSDAMSASHGPNENSTPRSFMLVSKPCVHAECPQRQGFIRGCYESVEFVREVRPQRQTGSSADTQSENPSITNSASEVDEGSGMLTPTTNDQDSGSSPGEDEHDSHDKDDHVIEWLMITRSDPGGSVPRFMVEKKTPEGIANDASKFLQWISSEKFESVFNQDDESTQAAVETTQRIAHESNTFDTPSNATPATSDRSTKTSSPVVTERNNSQSPDPGGVYGRISGALGMVASAAASRLLGRPDEDNSESGTSSDDDSSSTYSFHSFDDTEDVDQVAKATDCDELAPSVSTSVGGDSTHSTESTSVQSSHHDKELKKLEERRRKMAEKLQRAEERALAKRDDDARREQSALRKMREKHEREMAKSEERYERERRKLEAKRAGEERKAEARRRKQTEREERADLTLALNRARAEGDAARREVEMLAAQVGELQVLNTKLVARLGSRGVSLEDLSSTTASSSGSESTAALVAAHGDLGGPAAERDLGGQADGARS